jgi:hypothetical protein
MVTPSAWTRMIVVIGVHNVPPPAPLQCGLEIAG